MTLRYEEWLPRDAALRGVVAAYWRVAGDPSDVPTSVILPDGHVEIVANFGDPVGLAAPGIISEQPKRAVVGILSHAVRLRYHGNVDTFGIRLHPAWAGALLGTKAAALTNRILALVEVSPTIDRELAAAFAGDWRPERDDNRIALDRLFAARLLVTDGPDQQMVSAIKRLSQTGRLPPVAEMARDLGLSPRQFQRRFRASVGVAPKQFVRVFRFARIWQMASMGPPDTWAKLAAEYGYADQAHMVREFRAHGSEPPTQVFSMDWYKATDISRTEQT
jgi:AraC-like DNA-binding protein